MVREEVLAETTDPSGNYTARFISREIGLVRGIAKFAASIFTTATTDERYIEISRDGNPIVRRKVGTNYATQVSDYQSFSYRPDVREMRFTSEGLEAQTTQDDKWQVPREEPDWEPLLIGKEEYLTR